MVVNLTGRGQTSRDMALRLRPSAEPPAEEAEELRAAKQADLLIVEDVQHLPTGQAETLVQVLDYRLARQRPIVCTASVGPSVLDSLPARLTSRLAAGLVVRLEALAADRRRQLLSQNAQQRRLNLSPAVLDWLAEHLNGSGRVLEGALNQLEMLARCQSEPLDVASVARHFRGQIEASRPTLDRITERVAQEFEVRPRQLQSRRRYSGVLLPRQVSMYLARRLTDLSLQRIGAYFGGRDHTTVLHACQKLEQALTHDAALSRVVRQLHADLA